MVRSPIPAGAVEVVRGGTVESRHAVHLAVADDSGELVAALGDVDALTFYRSAAKPLQALPLVEDGVVERFGLTTSELALCCASHQGEAGHVDGARSILEKAGADEGLLACGPHVPFSSAAARALAEEGREPGRIHNNCSGKHAGMIALAVANGWQPENYHRTDHPVQRRMLDEVARWTGLDPDAIPTGIDGCGVLCFAVPLRTMATSFSRFTRAADDGEGPGNVIDAMVRAPFMVGGTGRACTDVIEAAQGRAFVKLGAEGVYGAGVRGRGWGVAIKVADGGRRAVEVALVRVLACLGVLDDAAVARLRTHANPDVRNTRGEVVGEIRAAFDLRVPALD